VSLLWVRSLPYAVADGATNMAADEVLLEAAALGAASLRFYGWSEPTISLGYFQPCAVRQEDENLRELAWVRRATGGATLVHHHEVTYALAVPAGPEWQSKQPWLRMHAVIAAALLRFGVVAQPHTLAADVEFPGFLCFQHLAGGDLMIGSHKITGSAQRKHHGAVLQHGGILLAASPHTPQLPGIRELVGVDLLPADLIPAIADAFTQQTGWRLEPGDWTDDERRQIAELAERKYRSDDWNAKR
jgi:lipoate-protein ligase A